MPRTAEQIWIVVGISGSGTMLPLTGFRGELAQASADQFITQAESSTATLVLDLRLLSLPLLVHDTTTPHEEPHS